MKYIREGYKKRVRHSFDSFLKVSNSFTLFENNLKSLIWILAFLLIFVTLKLKMSSNTFDR